LNDAASPQGSLVKPIVNSLRILRYLAGRGAPARATQVARDLSINPSTCFNILRTLVSENVLAFDPLSKTYGPSDGLLDLVDASSVETRQVDIVRPLLAQLAHSHRITATLWRRVGADRLVLAAVEHSPSDMRIDIQPGLRLPDLIGATGRLVAAGSGLDHKALEARFRKLHWSRSLGFEDYCAQVEMARQRGWAVDEGYYTRGIASIAALLPDRRGSFNLSLSAVTFLGQFEGEALEKLGCDVLSQARRMADMLYGRVDDESLK
jgi:DNA-binding IclR family transcriptional regulator